MKKDIVVGLGEIGLPILKLISKKHNAVGFDIDNKLMKKGKFQKRISGESLQILLGNLLLVVSQLGTDMMLLLLGLLKLSLSLMKTWLMEVITHLRC